MVKGPGEGMPFVPADQDASLNTMSDEQVPPETPTEEAVTGGPPPVDFNSVKEVESLDDAINQGAGKARPHKFRRRK